MDYQHYLPSITVDAPYIHKAFNYFALMMAVGCPGGLRLRNGQLDRDELFGLCLALHQKLGVKLPDDVSVGLQLAFLGFEVFWDISKLGFPPEFAIDDISESNRLGGLPPLDQQVDEKNFGHKGIFLENKKSSFQNAQDKLTHNTNSP